MTSEKLKRLSNHLKNSKKGGKEMRIYKDIYVLILVAWIIGAWNNLKATNFSSQELPLTAIGTVVLLIPLLVWLCKKRKKKKPENNEDE